jgi:predicted small metal-binding protein
MAKSRPATYEYACENLFPECTTTITGRSEDEVYRKARRHVREHHGALGSSKQTVRDLRTWVRPVA